MTDMEVVERLDRIINLLYRLLPEPKREEAFVERHPAEVGHNLRHWKFGCIHTSGVLCPCGPEKVPHKQVLRERLPDAESRVIRDDAGGIITRMSHEPAPTDDPRPDSCCGKCPPIVGGGYDCTCDGNPRCAKADTPEEWHVESTPDDLPGEPVEPSDLRAGDRVAYTWRGAQYTGKLVSGSAPKVLRSDTPDADGWTPDIVWRGEWCLGISDVRLIERGDGVLK